MAWVAPVISGASAIFNAVSQHKRNKQEVELANTSVQRRMADLRAAGINPALAYTQLGGAQTPNLEPVQFSEGVSQSTANAYSQSQQNTLMGYQKALLAEQTNLAKAQTAANAEQALKTQAERLTIVPANAENLASQSQQLDAQAQVLAKEFQIKLRNLDLLDEDLRNKRLTNDQLEKLQPLILQYQSFINEAQRLGLSEKEADSKFYEALGPTTNAVGLGAKLKELLKGSARTFKQLTK